MWRILSKYIFLLFYRCALYDHPILYDTRVILSMDHFDLRTRARRNVFSVSVPPDWYLSKDKLHTQKK